jgi:hypothetical protein
MERGKWTGSTPTFSSQSCNNTFHMEVSDACDLKWPSDSVHLAHWQMEIWLDSGFSGQKTIVVIEEECQCYTSPFQNSVSSYRPSKDLNCMVS